VNVSKVLTAKTNGPVQIALFALVLRTLLGSALWLTLMTFILGLNAVTKVFATDKLENANALKTMKGLLVLEPFVWMIAMVTVFAGQREYLLIKLGVCIPLHGTPISRWDVCATLGTAVPPVSFRNVFQAPIHWVVTVMRWAETVLEGDCVITLREYANVLLASSAIGANTKSRCFRRILFSYCIIH